LDIQLDLFQPGTEFSRSCTPTKSTTVASGAAFWCEDSFDVGGSGQPSDAVTLSNSGAFHELLILVPLKSTPAPTFPGESTNSVELLVRVTAASANYTSSSALLWQIVQSVRSY
jgi:hypothetical protein